MVHVLQKLQKDGAAYDPVRRQAAVPGGNQVPFYSHKQALMLGDFLRPQMMAMNVVPRLILADAS